MAANQAARTGRRRVGVAHGRARARPSRKPDTLILESQAPNAARAASRRGAVCRPDADKHGGRGGAGPLGIRWHGVGDLHQIYT
jgi:hypothetical protein